MTAHPTLTQRILKRWAAHAPRHGVTLDPAAAGILASIAAETAIAPDRMPPGESREPEETLSRREREVLLVLACGLSTAEMAHELYLSPDTIRSHCARIYRRLGVSSRLDAVLAALSRGDLDLPTILAARAAHHDRTQMAAVTPIRQAM
ncbi:helix-turn-helix domain-containing protein [Yinghuangia sp. YIM S09857]|uniref:helix-turn-helix domain-containing protein n=1 Tax=Yinghuangia sp. YIM S09857 TaxID=3436929 RepID=UPI003F53D1B4